MPTKRDCEYNLGILKTSIGPELPKLSNFFKLDNGTHRTKINNQDKKPTIPAIKLFFKILFLIAILFLLS